MKQTTSWRLGTAAVLTAAAVGAILATNPPLEEGTPHSPPPQAAARVPERGADPTAAPLAPTPQTDGLESLPASLRGIDVPGELEEDERGNLKMTRGVRDVFDHFLAATGEEPAPQIRQRLLAYIQHRLRPVAAAQAIALMDRYIAYKDQLDSKLGGSRAGSPDDVKARMLTVRDMRRRTFDPPVVAAFFGDDEAYDQYSLDRAEILADKTLSPQQAAARIAELLARQSPQFRQQRDALEMVQTLDTLTAAWQERKGSAAELRQLREVMVGKEAATRLETLDRETETWNSRVAAYLQMRDTLRTNPALADGSRLQAAAELRDNTFSAAERVRIETLERIHDSGASNAKPSPAQPRSN